VTVEVTRPGAPTPVVLAGRDRRTDVGATAEARLAIPGAVEREQADLAVLRRDTVLAEQPEQRRAAAEVGRHGVRYAGLCGVRIEKPTLAALVPVKVAGEPNEPT
jgi:hypothetical protein